MKNKIWGYARISTMKQRLERQIDNIKRAYPDAYIYKEEYTGTTLDRPEWNKLKKQLKPGDTVVFDEVSRMSRNAEEGFALYQELYNEGINIVFLKEKHLDTDTYRQAAEQQIAMTGNEVADIYIEATNKVLMLMAKKQIEIAFQTAQHEVDYLHQRTSEGVRKAQAEGKPVGRAKGATIETKKAKESKEQILKYSKHFNGMLNDEECIKQIGIARNSFYKYKAELKNAR